ncbi:Retinol dehydrogenase 12 [Entomortierella lignicola]|nr:Retinol dehydrogenase 12 [Entomortierella lignicola]
MTTNQSTMIEAVSNTTTTIATTEKTQSNVVVHTPATVAMQRGGLLFDRTVVRLSTSRYIPHRLVEFSILAAEIFILNFPEWIFGERSIHGVPPVEKRIANSIEASRASIEETVATGGRRKVAVLTVHTTRILMSILGGASGLGYMTAMAIAQAGYHLIIGDRATEPGVRAVEAIKAKTGNMNVEFFYLDLGSFKEIKSFAKEVMARTSVIDLLVNNAGVMDLPSFRPTAEGHDSQFGINHLGHYYLTHLLLPLIKQAPKARIVITGSSAHYGTSKINYAGVTSAKAYDRINNYCGSKLANVMYTHYLARTLAKTHPNITVNCLHPGSCRTGLFNHSWMLYILTTVGFQYLLRTPARGARTITYLALSEEVEGITGEFWFDERIRRRNPVATDVKLQEELVRYSNKEIGLTAEN